MAEYNIYSANNFQYDFSKGDAYVQIDNRWNTKDSSNMVGLLNSNITENTFIWKCTAKTYSICSITHSRNTKIQPEISILVCKRDGTNLSGKIEKIPNPIACKYKHTFEKPLEIGEELIFKLNCKGNHTNIGMLNITIVQDEPYWLK